MTETGVDAIVPWAAARCITQWKGERGAKSLAKWRATAREAGKQSRRLRFPEVADAMTTKQVAALLAEADFAAVLHEEGAASRWPPPNCPREGSIVLVVGPEGGVSPEELAAFAEAGAKPYRLGPQRAAHLHGGHGRDGAAAGPHRPLVLAVPAVPAALALTEPAVGRRLPPPRRTAASRPPPSSCRRRRQQPARRRLVDQAGVPTPGSYRFSSVLRGVTHRARVASSSRPAMNRPADLAGMTSHRRGVVPSRRSESIVRQSRKCPVTGVCWWPYRPQVDGVGVDDEPALADSASWSCHRPYGGLRWPQPLFSSRGSTVARCRLMRGLETNAVPAHPCRNRRCRGGSCGCGGL